MKILLWHGYLLSGSGSNIYTANIARSWRASGHDVLLLCQEWHVRGFDFVDSHGDFSPNNDDFTVAETGVPRAAGRCRVVRPAIGGLLPVYVYDDYERFTVKTFVELSELELERYTAANVDAMVTAIETHRPDVIVTGHEVMGPFIAREACSATGTSYLAKLHGSALEYAVKVQDRYLAYATEGLCGARVVAGGSRYMIEEASAVIPGWKDRAVVVNPGCDVDLFRPLGRRDDTPTVGYVGKLIVAKGVHNFLVALGVTAVDELCAVVVGYGGFERELRTMWRALREGDDILLRSVAEDGDGRPLRDVLDFLDSGRASDAYFRRVANVPLTFTGRLDHDALAKVLPTFDVLVVASIVAEAFGMVAAEAAACGVLPVVPRHSGIGEVGEAIEKELGLDGMLTFDPRNPIEGIAGAIDRVLELPSDQRRDLGYAASELARKRWSWDRVAETLLRHAVAG